MPKEPKNRDKYSFSLYGINIEKIDLKYGITPCISNAEDMIPENSTKIDELEHAKSTPEIVSFLDESKCMRKCTVSVIDFSKKNKYRCFWHRNPIPENVHPIGCPIRYIPSKTLKTYHSEISKENYTISESVTQARAEHVENRGDSRFYTHKRGYYETDGIFCSFNCCMAYINSPENKRNPLYRYSENLLIMMYNDVNNGANIKEISPAPHWRTLEEYGGHLSVEAFTQSFNKVDYLDNGFISFVSSGRLFEDKIKF